MQFQQQFGFHYSDLFSWDLIVTLLNRPRDPSSLALIRILFGIIMMLDIPQERGMGHLDERWGSPTTCHFPLFDFVQPLPLEWMYIVYVAMFFGALGMALGLFFRISAFVFVTTYWYVHLLDTITWNNHSYLFGLLGTLLLFTDAHHCWSLDGWRSDKFRNKHVPLWNYAILRFQIFVVYFIAGLKKTDIDWLGGYSMRPLSSHWVFTPFRLFLTEEMVDYYVVHLFGFLFDLTIGFFMFFDMTRPLAFVFCAAFNLMNSQLFCIGMFPYMMLAMMPIFCYADWLRQIFSCADYCQLQPSDHCLYSSKPLETNTQKDGCFLKKQDRVGGRYHRWAARLTIAHICLQLFLPYSHFITPGFNHWSNGLYGYSWDMMVHSWNTQHVRVTVRDKATGNIKFINPEKWVKSNRWTRYARLAQQYAYCVKRNMHQYGISDMEIYLDVWGSLNKRFKQRFFHYDMDILTAAWSPFRMTNWTLPLMHELTHWRNTLIEMTEHHMETTENTAITFLADFPGFAVGHSVNPNFSNMLEVLEGEILLETIGSSNVSLKPKDNFKMPSNVLHKIHVKSSFPACYMHTAKNRNSFVSRRATTQLGCTISSATKCNTYEPIEQDRTKEVELPRLVQYKTFLKSKLAIFRRSLKMAIHVVNCIIYGIPMSPSSYED